MNESQNHESQPETAGAEESNSRPALADRVRSLRLRDPNAKGPREAAFAWLPWSLCVLLAGVSVYLFARPPGDGSAAGDDNKNQEQPQTPIANLPAGSVALEAGGYIVPVRRVQVSPKVSGQVVELYNNLQENTFVTKGTVLAKLEKSRYQFIYNQKKALMEQAKARYDKLVTGNRPEEKAHSLAQLKESGEMLNQLRDREDRLVRAGLAASQDELVEIKSRRLQAEFKVQQLEQMYKIMMEGERKEEIEAVKQAWLDRKADFEFAEYDLENTDVKAPVDGVILEKKAELGDTVNPQVQNLSANVCFLADLSQLEVSVDVSERDLNRVFPGQQCVVRLEAPPSLAYDAYVARIMPLANRSKASVEARVRVKVPLDNRTVRPEMRARVQFVAGKLSPETAAELYAAFHAFSPFVVASGISGAVAELPAKPRQ